MTAFQDLSLRTRLVFLTAAIVLALVGSVSIVSRSLLHDLAYRGVERRAETMADLLAVAVAPGVDFDDTDFVARQLDAFATPDCVGAAVFRTDGSLIASWPTGTRPSPPPIGSELHPVMQDGVLHVSRHIDATGGGGAILCADLSLAELDESLEHVDEITVGAGTVLLGIGLFVTWVGGSMLVRSIERLRRTAALVADGDIDVRSLRIQEADSKRTTGNEARALAWEFDRILGKVADQVRQIEAEHQRARAAEARAVQSARARTEFVANMSHELRTPLHAILALSELLGRRSPDEPLSKSVDDVQRIHRAGQHLLGLVDDVLDYAKIEAGRMTIECIDFRPADSAAEALDLVRAAATANGVTLGLRLEPTVPKRVAGDPNRFRQVLVNLLSNAVRFTEHGSVEVRIAPVPGGGPCEVRAEVEDTGIGIREDVLPGLFDAFTQADTSTSRRFGGTGLGLAICRRLVGLMGGEIGAHSSPGHGSTFWFTVRFAEPSMAPEEMKRLRPADPAATRGMRVLVAEDNRMNQLVVRRMLQEIGCVASVVDSGTGALEAVGCGEFDAILMDCQMPGMDGYEATRRIRVGGSPGAGTPILALTAHAIGEERARCLDAGMDDYLTKPLRLDALRDALARWRSQKRRSQKGQSAHVA